jgi:N-acetylglucosamine-6-phosphate deacetylase
MLRVLVERVGLRPEAALRMATAVPAAVIGASGRCGGLAPGMPADLVHLDDGLALRGVWRAGTPVSDRQ